MYSPFIEQIPLFRDLTEAQRNAIAAKCKLRSYEDKAVILHKDAPKEGLFMLVRGKVKISYSDDVDETIIAVLRAGDFFGELSAIDGAVASADVVALDSTDVLHLSADDFDAIMLEMPEITLSLLKYVSKRLRRATEWIRMLSSQDVYGRIAGQLVLLAREHGEQTPDGIRIPLRLTQNDLAGLVGASRESVNKAVGFFKTKQYIAVDGLYRITIRDMTALARRSQ
jgi:CRP-like cAMP-binding protein